MHQFYQTGQKLIARLLCLFCFFFSIPFLLLRPADAFLFNALLIKWYDVVPQMTCLSWVRDILHNTDVITSIAIVKLLVHSPVT